MGDIPFRNSTLTKLLADSIAGHTHMAMVAAPSPAAESWDETLSSLRRRARARVKNDAMPSALARPRLQSRGAQLRAGGGVELVPDLEAEVHRLHDVFEQQRRSSGAERQLAEA